MKQVPILILLLFTVSCNSQTLENMNTLNFNPDSETQNLFGSKVAETIFQASSIEIYTSTIHKEKSKNNQIPFKRKEKGELINSEVFAIIYFLLSDISNYDLEPNFVSKCVFVPDFEIVFIQDEKEVSLFYCFNCNRFGFLKGSDLEFVDFKQNQQILKLAKKLFPNDNYIQKI